MAERRNFYGILREGETELDLLNEIVNEDGWVGTPETISEVTSIYPQFGVFKVTISVERVK